MQFLSFADTKCDAIPSLFTDSFAFWFDKAQELHIRSRLWANNSSRGLVSQGSSVVLVICFHYT